jgi:hypothetical protein
MTTQVASNFSAGSLCIIAHPDDEVIWMLPFLSAVKAKSLDQGNIEVAPSKITKVICLTCADDPIRRAEFHRASEVFGFISDIHSLPIDRGLNFALIRKMWELVSPEFSENYDACFTHSPYGDDHFHPQHMIVSLICTTLGCLRRVPVIYNSTLLSKTELAFSAARRSKFKVRSIFFVFIKLFTILTTFLITKKLLTLRVDVQDLNLAKSSYSSQNLTYSNMMVGIFRFRIFFASSVKRFGGSSGKNSS